MPTDTSNEVHRHVARSDLEMSLDGHKVIGDSAGDGGLHGGRGKLDQREVLVSHPLNQPVIIGGTQALITMHRPLDQPVKVHTEWKNKGPAYNDWVHAST